MFDKKFFYLVTIQYLGYRFHGWQKQPKVKTIHHMIDRTLKYIMEEDYFKTLGAGRTDAMVSAENAAFEIFTKKPLSNLEDFLNLFNNNLPQDIRALSISEVSEDFNIINHSKEKEYNYLFAHGGKFHPFCAPIMTTILDELDVDSMQRAAALFEGKHNFKAYCYKPSNSGKYIRTITKCELVENTRYRANFFPEKSYLLIVKGKGFGRNQIRLIMGALIEIGRGDIDEEFVKKSLSEDFNQQMSFIAPASGLILQNINF